MGRRINVLFCDLNDVENKQRLNLSEHAYMILMNDIGVFQVEEELKLGSTIINHIFRCYREVALSSIERAVNNKKRELTDILQAMPSEEGRAEAVELLVKKYKKQLLKESIKRQKQKGNSFLFRIDKENIEFLASSEGKQEGCNYKENVGHYIKAVIEEYCELPYVEREQIYCKEILREIRLAIADKKILKLTLKSKNGTGTVMKNNILYVKPVRVQQDVERMYNYLVGMISRTQDGPWDIGAVRLTSIKACRWQEKSAYIGNNLKKIDEAIRQRGVQYLPENRDIQKIIVQFTQEGELQYQRILHLRPLYVDKKGLIYEFRCTLRQAENYFFKFGSNVKILEPIELVQKFRREYQAAAEQYT